MEQIEFIFQPSAFEVEALVPQISRALEKRMQLRQQQMLPKLFQRTRDVKKKKTEDRYDRAAREFLEGQMEGLKERQIQVCFSTQEMITVIGALEDLNQDAVSFDAIELVMESGDIFFIVYEGRGVVLQKKDLTLGSAEEFRAFAEERIKPVLDLGNL